MNIALDYDDTFTLDEPLWRTFIANAEAAGHRCYVVTCRCDTDENREEVFALGHSHAPPNSAVVVRTGLPVYRHHFTGLAAKDWYMRERGIVIDVWIDDQPSSIVNGR